jgi:hypothetical protein
LETAFAEVALNWRDHVEYNSSLERPSDVACSIGDPAKGEHNAQLATGGEIFRDRNADGPC